METKRAHTPKRRSYFVGPNGLRLSSARKGVRCSRGFGDPLTFAFAHSPAKWFTTIVSEAATALPFSRAGLNVQRLTELLRSSSAARQPLLRLK